jgi:hypothetical protein
MEEIQPPIACTLRAADVPARAEEIRALGRDGLLSAEGDERRAVLRFRGDAATRARVERFVAAESECCAFLRFEIDGSGTLTIAAPEGAGAALADFVALLGVALRPAPD